MYQINIRVKWVPPLHAIARVAANMFNKQSRTADKRWSSSMLMRCYIAPPTWRAPMNAVMDFRVP